MEDSVHKPVMIREVLQYLSPKQGGVYVDGTFGAGGYSRAILEAADCIVIAIDRDESALQYAELLAEEFAERFVFLQGCFGDALDLLTERGYAKVDGFVLDLGVSSMQLDQAERGFSFRFDGPLDMRMGQGADQNAADIVNTMGQDALANLIYEYGEERLSRKIAKAIVLRREQNPFETTQDLADVVRDVVKKRPQDKTDPATRTFQALRIAVNDELGELERGMDSLDYILNPGGRFVVVSFHSLEDRIAKKWMRAKCGRVARGSKYLPDSQDDLEGVLYRDLTRQAVLPQADEVSENPRSRSAKLRAVEYLGVGS